MRRVVSSATPSTEVDRQLDNTAYENVLAVVRNMASIVAAGANVATYDALLLIQTEIEAIYADIDNVTAVGTDIANVNTLATNIAVLSSLYADKATLDSLFADKATLDSLFTDKATLDSLFASKAVLDSLYADKVTLDSLVADKVTLDSIFGDKATLDSIFADKTALDAVYANLAAILAVNTNEANVNVVAANVADVNNFALVYQIKATAPTVRVDTSALQEGDLWFDTTLNVLQKYDGAAYSVTTADTIATDAITFTNKTITDPSNEVGSDVVSYDNTISGLSATDAKAALDEITATANTKLSPVASSLLLSGQVALLNTTDTLGYDGIAYTGTGASLDLVTGISSVDATVSANGSGFWVDRSVASTFTVRTDAGVESVEGECEINISEVHIKSRTEGNINYTGSNFIFNGISGGSNFIKTDSTDAENTVVNLDVSFISTGFTLGSHVTINRTDDLYIAYQTLYTHMKWGVTNHGKKYVIAFNPVTRKILPLFEGSGLAGHRIPNPLGVALDFLWIKNLSTVGTGWTTHYEPNSFLLLNETNAEQADVNNVTEMSSDYSVIGISSWSNASGELHIMQGFANSETQGIYEYTGTGVAGNFVETRDIYGNVRKPARVIIKAVSRTGSWPVYDNRRGGTARLTLDSSAIETIYTGITLLDSGFTLNDGDADSWINFTDTKYIAIVEFDTNSDDGGSYFPLADLNGTDALIDVTAGSFSSVQGKDANGNYIHGFESAIGTIPNATFTGSTDGYKWVWKENGLGYGYFDYKPKYAIYDKTSAEENAPVLVDGVWMNTVGSELVTNGTFDTDVAGWSNNGSGTITWDASGGGRALITTDASYLGGTQTITTVVGELVTLKISTSTGSDTVGLRVGTSAVGYEYILEAFPDGSHTRSFIATTTTTFINLSTNGVSQTAYVDDISIFKKQATLGTPLGKNISILPNPVMVTGDKVQYIDLTDTLIENVMDDLFVAKIHDGSLNKFRGHMASNITTDSTIFNWTTDEDTLGCMSNGIYTCKERGEYLISARMFAVIAGAGITIRSDLMINGVFHSRLNVYGASLQVGADACIAISMEVGDTMYLVTNSTQFDASNFVLGVNTLKDTILDITYIGAKQ